VSRAADAVGAFVGIWRQRMEKSGTVSDIVAGLGTQTGIVNLTIDDLADLVSQHAEMEFRLEGLDK
jgi:hypothetical protein